MKQRMMEVVVTAGAIGRAKLQSNHYHQQTNTKSFLTGRMPFLWPNQQCQSTEGKQTNQPLLMEIIQARHLTLFGHIARIDDILDAMQILTSSPYVYWKRPPEQPWMTWMETVQNDLDSHGLSWTDAVDLAQNRPLWRLLATSGAMHS